RVHLRGGLHLRLRGGLHLRRIDRHRCRVRLRWLSRRVRLLRVGQRRERACDHKGRNDDRRQEPHDRCPAHTPTSCVRPQTPRKVRGTPLSAADPQNAANSSRVSSLVRKGYNPGYISVGRRSPMKLVRFSTNGQPPRLGALQDDRIVDLTASVAATLTARGVVRAREIAAALVPASTRAFIEGGPASADAVTSIKESVTVTSSSARLHAPIDDPAKFICIGLNYRDHAIEAGQPIPKEPPIFAKWAPSIVGP